MIEYCLTTDCKYHKELFKEFCPDKEYNIINMAQCKDADGKFLYEFKERVCNVIGYRYECKKI